MTPSEERTLRRQIKQLKSDTDNIQNEEISALKKDVAELKRAVKNLTKGDKPKKNAPKKEAETEPKE